MLRAVDGAVVVEAEDQKEETGEDEDEEALLDRVPAGYRVEVVSEDDVAQGKYSIADVVLPMLGSRVQLPTNQVREFMLQTLENEGLSIDVFTNKKHPQYALAGTYRRVVEMPQDFRWSIRSYVSQNEHLLPTDLDLLRNRQPMEEVKSDEHVSKALCLEFTLRSSTYATMFLRELTKQPTDVEHHAHMTAELQLSMSKRSRGDEEVEPEVAAAVDEGDENEPKRQKA